ncbi:hypothetical protein [Ureibacillus acetophenoni]|uniref:Uncharacterized protein n=1 Tax=Ureibacillus acetophenoni TaxID=614649 RepID=A0A285UP58_9BACL|nr:hypothetical protein [Ureibacillus acetophenoni]SOC43695.1 hypothetical protein SAMN05877842_11716 [Ureibacillus acetophenoni]
MHWGDMVIESKIFRLIIKGAFWTSIALAILILLMISNFFFKIIFLDYRFDDGELHPPIEVSISNGYLTNIDIDPKRD